MNKIKYYREKNNVTLEQVSKATGIPMSVVNRAELGRNSPVAERWKALAEYFGVSVAELKGET